MISFKVRIDVNLLIFYKSPTVQVALIYHKIFRILCKQTAEVINFPGTNVTIMVKDMDTFINLSEYSVHLCEE